MILGGFCLKNVLHVPDFKFNMLSASKLTKDLNYFVSFYPDPCVVQDIQMGKWLGLVER